MFTIETIHPPGVVEDQNDEAQDRALLGKPEAQSEAEKLDLIERFRENDTEAEGHREPDNEAHGDQAQISAPVAAPGFLIRHLVIPT